MKLVAIIFLTLCWMCTCPVAVDITDIDGYDPGSCDQSNALQVYSVNDRNNEKKLWICSKENGQYMWKPVDGDAYVGEFLNPGLNCSDILDHEHDAKDGFYWITLGGAKRKVWCDMTTDGGGFMLVARKHDAITWDIPSKDKPIGPHSSDKYWTSLLGDAPILDFRVQLSTADSFDGTQAHWSYRLNNKRPLGELLITDRGCDTKSPGIGDIAFVKDLMTNNIVTTGFQCSVFGLAYTSTQGWAKMNECLKTPCLGSGHIEWPGGSLNLDHTGIFSYSVSDKMSGYGNQATSLIGCDQKSCCGCFGPVGGTANYCGQKCSTINGGTRIDAKSIYTWMWVRSSLPKRIWNKCMEYQIPDENGQLEWFTLTGDSAIPKKGRCSNANNIRLNSGIKSKLIKLEKYMDSKLKELDTKYTVLDGKIDAGDAELKKINISIPQYYKLLAKVGTTYPECVKYQWLTDSTRYYNYYNSHFHTCDSYLTGWYRFGGAAGTRMSTSCQSSHHYCETACPGYMSGGHPGPNDGIVTRTVYFYSSNCQSYSTTIQVINCADLYYVYHLSGTPTCNARYCSS